MLAIANPPKEKKVKVEDTEPTVKFGAEDDDEKSLKLWLKNQKRKKKYGRKKKCQD